MGEGLSRLFVAHGVSRASNTSVRAHYEFGFQSARSRVVNIRRTGVFAPLSDTTCPLTESLSLSTHSSPQDEDALVALDTRLAYDMGLFLQKTNIIRDYLEDLVEGRAFWVSGISRRPTS